MQRLPHGATPSGLMGCLRQQSQVAGSNGVESTGNRRLMSPGNHTPSLQSKDSVACKFESESNPSRNQMDTSGRAVSRWKRAVSSPPAHICIQLGIMAGSKDVGISDDRLAQARRRNARTTVGSGTTLAVLHFRYSTWSPPVQQQTSKNLRSSLFRSSAAHHFSRSRDSGLDLLE